MSWDNFHSKIKQGGPEECWPWTACRRGGRSGKDYGGFALSPKEPIYAHRMAYALANDIDPRSLPKGLVVRHKCDNGICCNPRHLEPGTQADNARDMADRGRSTKGEKNPRAVLSVEDVLVIKGRLAVKEKHLTIALDFGVDRATISQIARGANWGWLTPPGEQASAQ